MNTTSTDACRAGGGISAIVTSITLVLIALTYGTTTAAAQTLDSHGTEFYITFMPNWRSLGVGEVFNLQIYLSSRTSAAAQIYWLGPGEGRIDVEIPADETVVVDLVEHFGDEIELVSDEVGSRKSFYINATSEITVSGANIRHKSADAFLALPRDVLGVEYYVLAYTNGHDAFSSGGGTQHFDMSSQLAVVATADNTVVTVDPPQKLRYNGGNQGPMELVLNRGEVFMVQADVGTGPEFNLDVTGTHVTSSKRVAVFSGNRRTSIPTSVGNFRDHLVEQMPSVDAWGTEAFLAPIREVTSGSEHKPVARIIAARDSTRWSINGEPNGVLHAGEWEEIEFADNPLHITATGPVMVAQYEHSVGFYIDGDAAPGDPFMMLVPSREQFGLSYGFQSIPHEEFTIHYIDVVVPTSAVTTLLLDGKEPTFEHQTAMISSGYTYGQILVEPGTHSITCELPFGLYVYGVGSATSYGYIGGYVYPSLVNMVEHRQAPAGLKLEPPVPNPSAGEGATLRLHLASPDHVTAEIIDAAGRRYSTLINNQPMPAGDHTLELNTDGLRSGTYFVKVTTAAGDRAHVRLVVSR